MALTKTPIELSSTQGIVDNSNATAITIDSSENVGIGVSPSAPLDVRRGDADGKIAEFHQSGGYGLELSSSQSVATITAGYNQAFTFETGTTATERMRIDASGNVDLYQGKNLTWRYAAGSTIRGSISVDSADNITFSNTSSNTERMRIDTSGNLLVGTTATTINTSSSVSGHNLFSSGYTVHSRSGQTVMSLNRLSTDGTIVDFRKNGTAVGSIGAAAGNLYIVSNDVGLNFAGGNDGIFPATANGAQRDAAIDLGASSHRFKDLYLSGAVNLTNSTTTAFTQVGSNMFQLGTNSGDPTVFYTSGSERMRIDSSGNVGIGVSSLNNPLEVGVTPNTASKTSGSAFDGAAIRLNGNLATTNSEVSILGGADNHIQAGIGFVRESANDWGSAIKFYTRQAAVVDLDGIAEAMRIDSSGNVGIGTTSATSTPGFAKVVKLEHSVSASYVVSAGANEADFGMSSNGGWIGTSTNVPMRFAQNSAERMRIDSSGNLLVGTTSQASASASGVSVNPSGYINSSRPTTGTAGHHQFFNPNGICGVITTTGTTTTYATSSDQRLKENIADADDAGSKIDSIQVRQYDWKADGSHQDYGMVAQELQLVAPEAVSVPEDSEEMMGVDYSKLVPMLVKEIQSLRNRVAQLEE